MSIMKENLSILYIGKYILLVIVHVVNKPYNISN